MYLSEREEERDVFGGDGQQETLEVKQSVDLDLVEAFPLQSGLGPTAPC